MLSETDQPLEYQLFGLGFQTAGAITYFAEHLSPATVGIGQAGLRQFYETLLHFYEKTGLDPVNPIAFRSWLEHESDLYEALGGGATVSLFMEKMLQVELSDAESVTKILQYRHNKRTQLDFLQELQGLVTKKGLKDEDEDERINYLTEQIRGLEKDLQYSPLERIITGEEIADGAAALWDLPDFLPTQYKNLNIAMGYTENGGFVRGAVYAIIAPSGKGKSTFSKCLMNHWVSDEGGANEVLFVNYEEPKAHWERILMTQVTERNVYKGDASAEEREELTVKFQEKMRAWGGRFMVRHDPDTPYFDDLEQWIRDIRGHNQKAPDVIIIDTIQSMFMKGKGSGPRWGEYEIMMVRLEKLAKDMNCVMIITAQENVNRMKENRDVVKQSDTGGSIAIQQKSTVTIFITEKKLKGDESEDSAVMELQIPKNRITGSEFAMDPAMVRYNDNIKSFEPYDAVPAGLYEDTDLYLDEDIHG